MQFVRYGPDIPEDLLTSHEEGRVVFFCGAGISYPAGLPGFQKLVDQIYLALGATREPIEEQAYCRKDFDATLDLLERRIPGQRFAVRKTFLDLLKPKLRRKGATETHAALLQLARGRDDSTRLVTTNFDRLFQHAMRRTRVKSPEYAAPLLPIPKNSRWDGVVYLHGLLPDEEDEASFNRLVLSSGDFGLAYLTERWAARFVGELFRNYIVCFVGYSIDDPVLRYMMDALAADRMLGEYTPKAYAFAACSSGEEGTKQLEWAAKGVTPILYEVPSGGANHSALHRTLRAWAGTYRDGIYGKEQIVVADAMTRPSASTRQDDFVSRMVWALSDSSGMPAKRFADFDPVPVLDWLEALSQDRYSSKNDLSRFGVGNPPEERSEMAFSLVRRPAPYTHAPWMSVTGGRGVEVAWDDVMHQLARWLLCHLDDPALLLFMMKHGGSLHSLFASMVEDRLAVASSGGGEGESRASEEAHGRESSRVLRQPMRTLWRLLLAGRMRVPEHVFDPYRWRACLDSDGLTPSLRLELRDALSPRISLSRPFGDSEDNEGADESVKLRALVNWELVLSMGHIKSALDDFASSSSWQRALPLLLNDVQSLLRDSLDLMCELGEANERSDSGNWDLPSIIPHQQNQGFSEWVFLIEILRDAWMATLEVDSERAQRVAADWYLQPYPTFKRLAFFAASQNGVVDDEDWVEWLLKDGGWWLWSSTTKREAIRLLVLRGPYLSNRTRTRLETGILSGPPREMYREDIEPEQWNGLKDHEIWLRLAKLAAGGGVTGGEASAVFERISIAYPEWRLAENESDEFSHWMSGTGDPDFDEEHESRRERTPREQVELEAWLRRPPSGDPWQDDDWPEFCREDLPTAAAALIALADDNEWSTKHWGEALQAWSDEDHVLPSWRVVSVVLLRMPRRVLLAIAHQATWWLMSVSKVVDLDDDLFYELCHEFLSLEYDEQAESDQSVGDSLNHPVGHATRALLHHWLRTEPVDRQGLPENLKVVFTVLCEAGSRQNRHARVMLAADLIALFRVDEDWTSTHLLPLFAWRRSRVEARAVWKGFLWSPRLYQPLLSSMAEEFLETARHYGELNEHGRQYASLLTYAALDPTDDLTADKYQTAFSNLNQQGVQESARALARALEGAGEQREEYWRNRIQPFWQSIWPKSLTLVTAPMAEHLARMAIAAGAAFPDALETVFDWLRPLDHCTFIVHQLMESGLCRKHPQLVLKLLGAIIADQPPVVHELSRCLSVISVHWPEAQGNSDYRRLIEYIERRRHE